jgi:hypothetical protein
MTRTRRTDRHLKVRENDEFVVESMMAAQHYRFIHGWISFGLASFLLALMYSALSVEGWTKTLGRSGLVAAGGLWRGGPTDGPRCEAGRGWTHCSRGFARCWSCYGIS